MRVLVTGANGFIGSNLCEKLIQKGYEVRALILPGSPEWYLDGIDVEKVYKVHEGRPNIVDLIKNGEIQLIINTPSGRISKADEIAIRKAAISYGVPLITTISGAQAVVSGIEELIRRRKITVRSLQEYHAKSYIYANSISSY